jgi:hypothetical protein
MTLSEVISENPALLAQLSAGKPTGSGYSNNKQAPQADDDDVPELVDTNFEDVDDEVPGLVEVE